MQHSFKLKNSVFNSKLIQLLLNDQKKNKFPLDQIETERTKLRLLSWILLYFCFNVPGFLNKFCSSLNVLDDEYRVEDKNDKADDTGKSSL